MNGKPIDFKNLAGTEVKGWKLVRPIGEGADGVVYEASKDDQKSAVKLFLPEQLAKNGLSAAKERLELQLALIEKGKHHENLVEVYDGGHDLALGTLFLIMELVPGTSLDKLVGKVPLARIEALAGQLASAARCLEKLELVHRDIKPANIVISDDFQKLTLLDFGIVYHLPQDDEIDRLSGMEFVATLRYSPPEFVWRIEDGNDKDAWQAITFYQIGATLHDMIMGKVLFSGCDQPRARLYDAVRDHSPSVESNDVPGWLVQTVQGCLVKDWRRRLEFVSWDGFWEPGAATEVSLLESRIRLRQTRKEEMRRAKTAQMPKADGPSREHQLWKLNNALGVEIRAYLISSTIFPKCSVEEATVSQQEYVTAIKFDTAPELGFESKVVFTITIGIDSTLNEATKLSFKGNAGEVDVGTTAWTEMFSVETAFEKCRLSFLDAVDRILSI